MTSPEPPIEGQVLLLAGAKASVAAERLPSLAARIQRELGPEIHAYRRRYERVYGDASAETFLVGDDHWEDLGDRVGMNEREVAAVQRAHEEQLLRTGRREDREEEFESALEIRSAVVIGSDRA